MTYWIHKLAVITYITYYEDDIEDYIQENYGDCEWGTLWEIKDERTNLPTDLSSDTSSDTSSKPKKKKKLIIRD
jgi:hypothetical protein